jgi:hypothetical protein
MLPCYGQKENTRAARERLGKAKKIKEKKRVDKSTSPNKRACAWWRQGNKKVRSGFH